MKGEVEVEADGGLVVARIRGEPSAEILRECQERVLALVREAGSGRVLYDTRAMESPASPEIPWFQRELDAQLGEIRLRRAIVVPDSRLAYLARLAFGTGDYRVFYEDLDAAERWLRADDDASLAR